jgi:23S rRNA (adenine2503-C2)-methyltransferase
MAPDGRPPRPGPIRLTGIVVNHLLETPPQALRSWLSQRGHPAYRGEQIRRWAFQKRAGDFAGMSDLPKDLRAQLALEYRMWSTRVAQHLRAEDGTEKLLLELSDGARIECVLLRDGKRRSICISTQVGCAMGCVFCASGLDGVDRDLTSGEMLEQMLRLQRLLAPHERLSHMIVMGMGEPLANLDGLLPALDEASRQDGLGISARRITISTVGLPKAIDRLAGGQACYRLAVSLHAPDDRLRSALVPVNKNTGLREILAASDRYFEASGRRLTYEYVLLADINDRPAHARQLARLLQGRPALLNVIPCNPVAGLSYRAPSPAAASRFCEILEQGGVTVKRRRRRGHRIDAACGQLRRAAPVLLGRSRAGGNPGEIRS